MICCLMLEQALKEKVINYSPKFREYSISVPDGGSSYITIKHCPWCAFRVPSSLRDMWFDILDEMGCEPGDKDIPAKFQTDDWWLEREL